MTKINNKHKEKDKNNKNTPKDPQKKKEDKELDQRLKDTFPASDSTAEY